MECIAYRSGYKYPLKFAYSTVIDIKPQQPIQTEFIQLATDGTTLTIKNGYAWDGPSGPTIDTRDFMRGSLVHDALYQLMRERHLDHDTYREAADRILQRMCKEDGMSSIRTWWVYQAVRIWGDPAADPSNDKPVVWAPADCR
jgi:hypothetical protein